MAQFPTLANWSEGEEVTHTKMNTQVYQLARTVSGELGIVEFKSGIAPASMSTSQRNALTPEVGAIIWNTTTSQTEVYDGSAWNAIAGDGEANVQANWTESDTSDDAFIKNKPTIPAAANTAPINSGSTPAIGTSARYARQDHNHAITAGGGSTVSLSNTAPGNTSTASAGTSSSASRSDHDHGVSVPSASNSAPGNTGTAAQGTSTRYARQDHDHGVSVPSASSTSPVNTSTAAVGTSTTYARGDHDHGITTGGSTVSLSNTAPGNTGTASAGTASSASRSDHDHGVSVPSASSTSPVNTSTAAVGTSTTYARGDHDHGITASGSGIPTDAPVQIPSLTTTERDAIANPDDGMLIYNETTEQPEWYVPVPAGGSEWRMLPQNSVGSVIIDSSINVNNLAANSVSEVKIQNGAVTSDKIAADAVTNAKIADNAVQTGQIQDAAVTPAKLSFSASDEFPLNDASSPQAGSETNYSRADHDHGIKIDIDAVEPIGLVGASGTDAIYSIDISDQTLTELWDAVTDGGLTAAFGFASMAYDHVREVAYIYRLDNSGTARGIYSLDIFSDSPSLTKIADASDDSNLPTRYRGMCYYDGKLLAVEDGGKVYVFDLATKTHSLIDTLTNAELTAAWSLIEHNGKFYCFGSEGASHTDRHLVELAFGSDYSTVSVTRTIELTRATAITETWDELNVGAGFSDGDQIYLFASTARDMLYIPRTADLTAASVEVDLSGELSDTTVSVTGAAYRRKVTQQTRVEVSDTTPVNTATASAGTAASVSRADHDHGISGSTPSDATPVNTATASAGTATTYSRGDHDHGISGSQGGGEANVQADWSETDTGDDAFIKNKPTIPSAADASPLNSGTAAVGTSTDYAREDHNHGISVPSAGTTAPGNTSTAAVGTSSNYARQDHDHGVSVPSASNTAPGNTGTAAQGTSTRYARQDHDHGVSVPSAADTAPGNTTTAAVGTSTQYAREDHDHGVSVPSASNTAPGNTGTAAQGTSTRYARQDHDHGVSVPSASNTAPGNTGTAAQGSSTRYARQDHDHGVSVPSASSSTPVNTSTAAVGTATTYARGDHDHGITAGGGSTVSLSNTAPGNTSTASAGTSSSASRSDHDHGVSVPSASNTAPGNTSTAAQGSSTRYARQDHDHGVSVPSAADTAPGNTSTAAVGTSTQYAREDHDHGVSVPSLSDTAPGNTSTASAGTSSDVSRADHDHGVSATATVADGSITTVKLADDAVTNAKIADNAVLNAQIADGAVTSAKIDQRAVGHQEMGLGAVHTDNLENHSVTPNKMAHGVYDINLAPDTIHGDLTAITGRALVVTANTDTLYELSTTTRAAASLLDLDDAVETLESATGNFAYISMAYDTDREVVYIYVRDNSNAISGVYRYTINAETPALTRVINQVDDSDMPTIGRAMVYDENSERILVFDSEQKYHVINPSDGSVSHADWPTDVVTDSAANFDGAFFHEGQSYVVGYDDDNTERHIWAVDYDITDAELTFTLARTLDIPAGLSTSWTEINPSAFFSDGDTVWFTGTQGTRLYFISGTEWALTPSEISDSGLIGNSLSSTNGATYVRPRDARNGALADGSVATENIQDAAVETEKLADASVTHDKLATDAVEADKLADASVTHDKLATDAVEADNIKDGEVGTSELASDAVTAAKLADDAVVWDNLNDSLLSIIAPAGEVKALAVDLTPSEGASARLLKCNGQAVNRTGTYARLFTAIGTTYGAGNGSTTFNLPDFRGRVLAHIDTRTGGSATLAGVTGLSDTTGEKAQTISAHNHKTPIVSAGGTPDYIFLDTDLRPSETNSVAGTLSDLFFAKTAAQSVSGRRWNTASGGASSVPVVQPTAAIYYYIRY